MGGPRLILDLLYFLIVLVVLLNIICGIDGIAFDQASSEPGSAFKRHIKNDHYMWNYLSFIIFIWEQDRDDDDGLELYVRKMLEKGETVWFPAGRALCLQTEDDHEETVADHIEKARL